MTANIASSEYASAESTAWLLVLNDGCLAAIGELELRHLLLKPNLYDIPCSPFYCHQVLIWEKKILPVFDFAAWLSGCKTNDEPSLVGVVAYQESSSNTIEYGVLHLIKPPKKVSVHDAQVCELPNDEIGWDNIAISCFADNDQNPIPILNLSRIFSLLPTTAANLS